MNNPLGPIIGPGYFSQASKNNKAGDLKKIVDLKDSFETKTKSIPLPSKVLVINLKEREDRWELFKRKNRDILDSFEVSRKDGIIHTDPPTGIFLAHLECMERSKEINEPIIVMEDDCEMASGWMGKLESVFKNIPEDWDLLVGNHYFYSQMDILTDHLAKPRNQASTANFVIYSPTCYDKVKAHMHLRHELNIEDVDHFLTSEKIPTNNYTIWPMISREFVTFSDHHKKVRNMELRLREHAYQFPFIDSDTYYPSIESW